MNKKKKKARRNENKEKGNKHTWKKQAQTIAKSC